MGINIIVSPSSAGNGYWIKDSRWGSNYPYTCYRTQNSGYDWLGWSWSSSGSIIDTDDSHGITQSQYNSGVTIYARFQRHPEPTYTYYLRYNANGGSGAPSTKSGTTTSTSWTTYVSSTRPTRSGYNFLGWSFSSSATSPSYDPGDEITLYSSNPDRTLYAVWEEKPYYNYYLRYNANGGSGAPATKTGYTQSTQWDTYVSTTEPTRSGYIFEGWSFSSSATSPSYSPGDPITLYSSNPDRTLYAVWERDTTVNLTLDIVGSGRVHVQVTNPISGQVYFNDNVSTDTTFTYVSPVKFAFSNNGAGAHYQWSHFVEIDGSTTTGNYDVTFSSGAFTGTVKAVYEPQSYTVSFGTSEGVTNIRGTGTYQYNTPVTIVMRPNAGYIWQYFTDENGNQFRGTEDSLGMWSYTFNIAANKTFTGHALKEIYHVTVKVDDAIHGIVGLDNKFSTEETNTYGYGDTYTINAFPNSKYQFKEWSDGVTTAERTITCTGDATYIAYFEERQGYTITLRCSPSDAGFITASRSSLIPVTSQIYDAGEHFTFYARPEEGYEFDYWEAPSSSYTTRNNPPTEGYADKDETWIAHFKSIIYTVEADVFPDSHAGDVDGDDDYYYGEKCYLNAYPSELHRFDSWDDGDSSNPKVFRVYDDEFFVAKFERWPNMFVGDSRVKAIYLGDIEISKAILGETNVYLY